MLRIVYCYKPAYFNYLISPLIVLNNWFIFRQCLNRKRCEITESSSALVVIYRATKCFDTEWTFSNSVRIGQSFNAINKSSGSIFFYLRLVVECEFITFWSNFALRSICPIWASFAKTEATPTQKTLKGPLNIIPNYCGRLFYQDLSRFGRFSSFSWGIIPELIVATKSLYKEFRNLYFLYR